MKKEKMVTVMICMIFLIAAGGFYLKKQNTSLSNSWTEPNAYEENTWKTNADNEENLSKSGASSKDTKANEAEIGDAQDLAIYICGAVKHPGVYYLKGQPRVCDAVKAAGGFQKKAAKSSINQARILSDGEQITIPSKKSLQKKNMAVSSISGDSSSKLININTADISELTQLTGVGEAKAQMIIDYREENGSFQSIEDIMNISGIKEGVYNQIKDCITV